MGCGASKSTTAKDTEASEQQPLAVVPPDPTSKTTPSPASAPEVHSTDPPAHHSYHHLSVPAETEATGEYPLHVMRVSDFMKLKSLEPHQAFCERGLVVPYGVPTAAAAAARGG